jgi:excisionase family DNA binding protein
MEKTNPAAQCLGREEVARRLGVSQRKADMLILGGQIRSFKVGKKRLVTEAALSEFIEQREAVSARK